MALPTPTTGATALVTGASSGIGEALARQLAARGHDLVLVARRADRLDRFADELGRDYGVRAEFVTTDLTDARQRASLVSWLGDEGLEVSVLVNNAGFATGGRFAEADHDREVQQTSLLVEAVVSLTATFLPGMVERGSGAVLNVASTAAFQPLPYSAGYSAAKAHTLALSEALHHEVGRHGVTVTALCPGPVRTEFWKVAGDQPIKKTMPRPMWVDVDAVAAAGIRGLERGRRVVVPGRLVRASTLGSRATPRGVMLPLLAAAMRPRRVAGQRA